MEQVNVDNITTISKNYENKVSIKDFIPNVNEVIPYTWNSKQYKYKKIFKPIIKQFLEEKLSSQSPKFIHMLGVPGAGKSTFYQQHKQEFDNYVLIDFDKIMEKVDQYHNDILLLGKDEAFKKWEIPARIAGYEILRLAIKTKKNIFFDHGGSPSCHKDLLQQVKKIGYETTMYYLECDAEIAFKHVKNRERPFPKERLLERVALINKRKDEMPQIVDHFIKVNISL